MDEGDVMKDNAEIIQNWRHENPDTHLTETLLKEILGVKSLDGLNLSGANLSGTRFEDYTTIIGTIFEGADLSYTSWRNKLVDKCVFNGANLQAADFTEARIDASCFEGADLTETTFEDARISNLNFARTILVLTCFNRTKIWHCSFDDADLKDAIFTPSTFKSRGVESLEIYSVPSGITVFYPTPNGWRISVGCWQEQSLDSLKQLISAPDWKWPTATGVERERREPILRALLKLCKEHKKYYAEKVEKNLGWKN